MAAKRAEIRIGGDLRGARGTITVDGKQLTGVTGFTLSHSVLDAIPKLEVELLVIEDAALCEEAHVTIPDRTRETLIALGWTPPTDDDGA